MNNLSQVVRRLANVKCRHCASPSQFTTSPRTYTTQHLLALRCINRLLNTLSLTFHAHYRCVLNNLSVALLHTVTRIVSCMLQKSIYRSSRVVRHLRTMASSSNSSEQKENHFKFIVIGGGSGMCSCVRVKCLGASLMTHVRVCSQTLSRVSVSSCEFCLLSVVCHPTLPRDLADRTRASVLSYQKVLGPLLKTCAHRCTRLRVKFLGCFDSSRARSTRATSCPGEPSFVKRAKT